MSAAKLMARALLALLAAAAAAFVSPAVGRDYGYCAVCHGAEGNSNPAIHAPKIAGMSSWYLEQELRDFKAGLRGVKSADAPGEAMRPIAVALTDQDIRAVAAYVRTLAPRELPATVSGDSARGRALYQPCAACHGARGEGDRSLGAPALSGQADWYLVTALRDFRDGLRGFSPQDLRGERMRAAAATLTGTGEIDDLVAYIDTLQSPHKNGK